MTFKPVGVDENSRFPGRVEDRLGATFTPLGGASAGLYEAIPNLADRIFRANDADSPTIRVLGIGNSVMNNSGVDSAAEGILAAFVDELTPVIAPAGEVAVTTHNAAVGGTVVSEWIGHYDTWKASNGVPDVVYMNPGANDFPPAQWNAGVTFDRNEALGQGFVAKFKALLDHILADGVDVFVVTTHHRHPDRVPYGGGLNPDLLGSVAYPSVGGSPVYSPDGSPGQEHYRTITLPSGNTVEAEYRYLRGNRMIRQICSQRGVVCIDAERYWLEAAATAGWDALFKPAEYVHPNAYAVTNVFRRACREVLALFTQPVAITAHRTQISKIAGLNFTKQLNAAQTTNSTSLGDISGSQMQIAVAAGQKFAMRYRLPLSATADTTDVAFQPSVPSGATFKWGLNALATTATDTASASANRKANAAATPALQAGLVNGHQEVEVWITGVAGTAGTVKLQWATVGAGTVTLGAEAGLTYSYPA